jgi:hypothetical protein
MDGIDTHTLELNDQGEVIETTEKGSSKKKKKKGKKGVIQKSDLLLYHNDIC